MTDILSGTYSGVATKTILKRDVDQKHDDWGRCACSSTNPDIDIAVTNALGRFYAIRDAYEAQTGKKYKR